MPQRFFLDTNIIIYSLDDRDRAKRLRAKALIEDALGRGAGVVSYQVVQECLHLMLRKFEHRFSVAGAQAFLHTVLLPLCDVFPDGSLFSEALAIAAETGWSFYDCLIVGSAIAARCDLLFTEDLQHGRTIRGVTIRNPFV